MPYSLKDIKSALNALSPEVCEIVDESGNHFGHTGYKEGIITHIAITLKAPLEGTRLEKHRQVNTHLKPFFDKGLHAVRLSLLP